VVPAVLGGDVRRLMHLSMESIESNDSTDSIRSIRSIHSIHSIHWIRSIHSRHHAACIRYICQNCSRGLIEDEDEDEDERHPPLPAPLSLLTCSGFSEQIKQRLRIFLQLLQ
jgi:hypothetical protein